MGLQGGIVTPEEVEADAAALRMAFNHAAETYPHEHPMPQKVQEWWAGMYKAITDRQAGLGLLAELRRLKRGDFTPEEFQALCHHRDEKPGCTLADFGEGCREYQRKLFGSTHG